MGSEHGDERAIFNEAAEIESPEERRAYLDRACGDDAELRAAVEELLRLHDTNRRFLDAPVLAGMTILDTSPVSEGPGDVIGRYKLLQQIGEGGFGVVYMADQLEPVRRRVALKIIKLGMDTRAVVARFEAERQALALMEHPNIARALDAGATETGRPYFVMELVRGIPITEYCDRNSLSTEERLQLFMQVCSAVQHAHQKGVIHRDLKPSNVLVTLHDGKPVPKVIDFGIARAMDRPLTERTLFTSFGQFVGTPQYMSPEQAEMSGLDVDTRADIYTLGVLLYELLTGTPPFEEDTLRSGGYDEMCRIIREVEPPKPSTRISTMGDKLTEVAKHRHAEPAVLSRLIRGDLDWIVMKALEKDRTRRYETATGLAEDIQRHLNDEPVVAGPPGAVYRIRKFVRRNRLAVTAGLLVAASLLLGLCLATAGFLQARRNAERADRAASEAAALADFLAEDVLGSAAPEKRLGREVKVTDVLVSAEGKIDTAFADQPLVEAAVRHTMGTTYLKLGQYEDARRHLLRAVEIHTRLLGPEHPDTLASMGSLAIVLGWQGHLAEARRLHEETLGIEKRVLGPEHPDTLSTMNNLAIVLWWQGRLEEARRLHEETLEVTRRVLGPEHPDTLASMSNLADVLKTQGELDDARKVHEEALEVTRRVLGPEHPDTLASMNSLATVLTIQGELDEARRLHEETLELRRRVLGSEHRDTLNSMSNLALVLAQQGHLEKARRLDEETLEVQKRILGPEHPDTLGTMNNLAGLLRQQGELDEARKLLEETLQVRQRILGPEHLSTLTSMEGLANVFAQQGHLEEARRLHEEALEVEKRVLGPEHPITLTSMHNLACALSRQGRYDDAERLFEEALEDWKRVLGPEHPHTLHAANNLADVCARRAWSLTTSADPTLRDPERALELGVKAVELNPQSRAAWLVLGWARYRLGDWQASVDALQKSMGLEGGTPSGDSFQWFCLAMAHWQLGRGEEAREWYDRAVEWMAKERPDDEELRRLRSEAAALLGLPKQTTQDGKEVVPREDQ